MFRTSKKDLEDQIVSLTAANTSAEDEIEQLKKVIKKIEEDHDYTRTKWHREREDLVNAETILKKQFDDQKALAFKTMELEFKGKMQDQEKKLREELDIRLRSALDENFSKLKDSLSKLHEEGNAQTKFTEQIALKMMDAIKPGMSNAVRTTPVIEDKVQG